MNGYIERLILCGYTLEKAREIYRMFVNNFTLGELDIFIRHKENTNHVDQIQQ